MRTLFRWIHMRLACGIVVLCIGLPPWGVASAQQDSSGQATTTSQAPEAGASHNDTPTEQKKEPPAEQKKDAPAEPSQAPPEQTPPQQSTPQQIPAQQNTPTEPAAEPGSEPQSKTQPQPSEPGIEPLPSKPGNEPEKKADADGRSANGSRHVGKKRVTATDGSPQKIIVRHGGIDEPTAQIVTGMAPEEANRQRQHAEQLLRSTEETLKQVDPLAFDPLQQETVSQIHNYIDHARLALMEGDISRGHTLAQKAGLLAQDLVKHSQAAKEINSAR